MAVVDDSPSGWDGDLGVFSAGLEVSVQVIEARLDIEGSPVPSAFGLDAPIEALASATEALTLPTEALGSPTEALVPPTKAFAPSLNALAPPTEAVAPPVEALAPTCEALAPPAELGPATDVLDPP